MTDATNFALDLEESRGTLKELFTKYNGKVAGEPAQIVFPDGSACRMKDGCIILTNEPK